MDRFRNTRQPDWDWWSDLWPQPEDVLETLCIDPDESVADVGSGDGYFTLAAAERVAPAPVYAVDIDPDLLEDLRGNAAAAGLTNVEAIEGDARELSSLIPEPVAVVLVANTFHGVENPAQFAEQVRRSLEPGGRLIVVNWHDRSPAETPVAGEPRGPPPELRLSPDETVEQLSSAFDATRTVDLPPHHYAVVAER